jgi:hypothetical protein
MSTTQGNWWQQNWMWAVPAGCLASGCLGLLVLLGLLFAGGAGMFSIAFGLVKSSGPYRTHQLATERVENDPAVIQQLGKPISTGWATNTRSKEEGNIGKTCMIFPVSGSKRSGSVYVETIKSASVWNFRQLVVKVDGSTESLVLVPLPEGDNKPLCPDSEFPKPSPSPKDSTESVRLGSRKREIVQLSFQHTLKSVGKPLDYFADGLRSELEYQVTKTSTYHS